jgi:hypothetical protein
MARTWKISIKFHRFIFSGSMLFATPSLFCDMIAKARQHEMKFTTLKYVGYGGAPCPMAVALEMKEVFNVKRLVVSIEVFLKQ